PDPGTGLARSRSHPFCRAGTRACGNDRAPHDHQCGLYRLAEIAERALSKWRLHRVPRHRAARNVSSGRTHRLFNSRNLGLDLSFRDDLLLNEQVAYGTDPLLVIGGRVVLLLAVVLDHATHGIDFEGTLL